MKRLLAKLFKNTLTSVLEDAAESAHDRLVEEINESETLTLEEKSNLIAGSEVFIRILKEELQNLLS
jgi:hypothetical protein